MIKVTKTAIIAFFAALILSFMFVGVSHAQEDNPEQAAKKYGITFPVAELGGCQNISACKSFCEKEENRDQCTAFAKKKGFYQERRKDEGIINEAKSSLGCDSESSCKVVCEKEENREKCSSFAQKHGLGGGPRGNPGDRKILEKARELLGCDSEASCKSVCENPDNQEKCSNFASQSGLGGGVRKVGPGGCNSEESCRSFCQNNQDECRKFGGGPPEGADGGRRGPGGCDSEESCRKKCEENPSECGFSGKEGQDRGQRPPESYRVGPDGQRDFRDFQRPTENFERPPSDQYQAPPEQYRDYQPQSYEVPRQETQQTESYQQNSSSGPSSGGGDSFTPQTQEVRGASSSRGLLHQLLDLVF